MPLYDRAGNTKGSVGLWLKRVKACITMRLMGVQKNHTEGL